MKVAMLYLKKIVYTAIENADFFTRHEGAVWVERRIQF
jgi:hypothetical protein